MSEANLKGWGVTSLKKSEKHLIEINAEFDRQVTAREAEEIISRLITKGVNATMEG